MQPVGEQYPIGRLRSLLRLRERRSAAGLLGGALLLVFLFEAHFGHFDRKADGLMTRLSVHRCRSFSHRRFVVLWHCSLSGDMLLRDAPVWWNGGAVQAQVGHKLSKHPIGMFLADAF